MQAEATKNGLFPEDEMDSIVWGNAPAIQELNAAVRGLARTTIPVILVGESGTGKEVYARAVHRLSGGQPDGFKKMACAAMEPAQLVHTLASLRLDPSSQQTRTLFLDEIAELAPDCQKVLLTMVPRGELSAEAGTIRARVISATTHEMEKEVELGRFRPELYFRLNGARLRLPPLRERVEDIAALADYFLQRNAEEFGKTTPTLNKETLELLLSYHWPGNIRELENATRKMVALGDTSLVVNDLHQARMNLTNGAEIAKGSSLKMAARAASRQTERELILSALERTKWNRKRAARELQISYKSLLYKLKQIEGLDGPRNK